VEFQATNGHFPFGISHLTFVIWVRRRLGEAKPLSLVINSGHVTHAPGVWIANLN
jgi:hypothetical protein